MLLLTSQFRGGFVLSFPRCALGFGFRNYLVCEITHSKEKEGDGAKEKLHTQKRKRGGGEGSKEKLRTQKGKRGRAKREITHSKEKEGKGKGQKRNYALKRERPEGRVEKVITHSKEKEGKGRKSNYALKRKCGNLPPPKAVSRNRRKGDFAPRPAISV